MIKLLRCSKEESNKYKNDRWKLFKLTKDTLQVFCTIDHACQDILVRFQDPSRIKDTPMYALDNPIKIFFWQDAKRINSGFS